MKSAKSGTKQCKFPPESILLWKVVGSTRSRMLSTWEFTLDKGHRSAPPSQLPPLSQVLPVSFIQYIIEAPIFSFLLDSPTKKIAEENIGALTGCPES